MTRPFLLLGLSLALMTALPAVAQTTTDTATTPAPATDAAPSDLSMGIDPNAAPALPSQADAELGKPYLANTFDLWELRCVKKADGSDPCQLYQLLRDKDGNQVAEFSIFALPAGGKAAAGATVIVPLETLLTANLQLSVDGAKPKIYPYTFCTKEGCIARIGFTADEVAQLKKGAGATMSLIPAAAPDVTVDLAISLKGFTAGFDAVTAANLPK